MISEKEFLDGYDIGAFERPSVTTDVVAFTIRSETNDNYRQDSDSKLCILLIRRGEHPYLGRWALPGGFLQPGETVEQCALREIREETGVTPASLMPVGVFSEPGRDPRGWIISNAYASVLSGDAVRQSSGDDAADAQWFDLRFETGDDGLYRLTLRYESVTLSAILAEEDSRFGQSAFRVIDSGDLAFDHAKIIATALTALRSDAKKFDAIFDFLPETFTLTELQKVQEVITDITILPANFRRKIADLVTETGAYTQGAGHRPARLYRRRKP